MRRRLPSVAAVVFILTLTVCAFTTCTCLYAPVLPLLALGSVFPPARTLFRRWTGVVECLWMGVACFLLEHVFGIEIECRGDSIGGGLNNLGHRGEMALIISNHRTRIDWMFVWCLVLRLGTLDSMKIVLKDSLKRAGWFGYSMQCMLFLFLARDRTKDLDHMDRLLGYQASNGDPMTLLLFPEGTDLAKCNLKKSDAYAEKNGLRKYKNVLHPKTAGYLRCLTTLTRAGGEQRGPAVAAVYDLTMGYVDFAPGERPSELSLLYGRPPRKVLMHMKRHPLASLPSVDDPAAVEKWCKAAFERKEDVLTHFYAGKGDGGKPSLRFGADDDGAAVEHGGARGKWFAIAVKLLCVAAHAVITLLTVRALRTSPGFRLYALGVTVFFYLATKFFGGLDRIELALCSAYRSDKERGKLD